MPEEELGEMILDDQSFIDSVTLESHEDYSE